MAGRGQGTGPASATSITLSLTGQGGSRTGVGGEWGELGGGRDGDGAASKMRLPPPPGRCRPQDAVAVLGRASKGLGGGGGSSSTPLPWEGAVWQVLSAGCWPQPAVVSPFALMALQDGVDFILCPVPARVSLALRIARPATPNRCPLHAPDTSNTFHIEPQGHVVTWPAQDGSLQEVQCRPAGCSFGVTGALPPSRDRGSALHGLGSPGSSVIEVRKRARKGQGAKCGQEAAFPSSHFSRASPCPAPACCCA